MRLLLLLLYIAYAMFCYSQEEVVLTGIVLDRDGHKPLPGAVMNVSRHVYCADASGRITARVRKGDIVAFAHMGYQSVRMEVTDSLGCLGIFGVLMSADTIMLSEVIARPRKLSPKQMASTMPAANEVKTLIARNNVLSSRYIAISRPQVDIDADAASQRQLGNFVTQQVYEGMVSPSQIFGFSLTTSLGSVMKAMDNVAALARIKNDVKPVSKDEIDLLLGPNDKK